MGKQLKDDETKLHNASRERSFFLFEEIKIDFLRGERFWMAQCVEKMPLRPSAKATITKPLNLPDSGETAAETIIFDGATNDFIRILRRQNSPTSDGGTGTAK